MVAKKSDKDNENKGNGQEKLEFEQVKPAEIVSMMKDSYIDYAMSVIVARASRCPRRLEARSAARFICDAGRRVAPHRQIPQVRHGGGFRAGALPSARRCFGL